MSSRPVRVGAWMVTALLALGALTACGSSDLSEAQIAKQDRQVVQASRAQAQYEAAIKAAMRKRWRARAREQARLSREHAQARAVTRPAVTGSGGGDLCGPIRKRYPGRAGQIDQDFRRRRRRQALYYLNLRCPARGT